MSLRSLFYFRYQKLRFSVFEASIEKKPDALIDLRAKSRGRLSILCRFALCIVLENSALSSLVFEASIEVRDIAFRAEKVTRSINGVTSLGSCRISR